MIPVCVCQGVVGRVQYQRRHPRVTCCSDKKECKCWDISSGLGLIVTACQGVRGQRCPRKRRVRAVAVCVFVAWTLTGHCVLSQSLNEAYMRTFAFLYMLCVWECDHFHVSRKRLISPLHPEITFSKNNINKVVIFDTYSVCFQAWIPCSPVIIGTLGCLPLFCGLVIWVQTSAKLLWLSKWDF